MSARMASADGLARKRRLVALSLWIERLAPALAPMAAVMLGFVCAAWLGLLALLPPLLDLALLIAGVLAALGLAGLGLTRVAAPSAAAVDRRLERDDPHRPLATLADRPALSGADDIWQAHRERALARAARLRPSPPQWGRQGAAVLATAGVLTAVSLFVAGGQAPGRLWHALTPAILPGEAPPARVQAWIVPPHGLGLPPIFLHVGDHAPIAVPVGARLTVSVLGGRLRPTLVYGTARRRFMRLDRASFQSTQVLTAPGVLEVRRAGDRMAAWRLDVAAAAPPRITITGAGAIIGRQLRMNWQADDTYGLASVEAELQLRDRPGAAPLVVPIPLSGLPRSARGGLLPDLTANPWAGLPVLLRYVAHDSSGLRGVSEDRAAVLPERAFVNPLARALILVRRHLVLDPGDTVGGVKQLDALSLAAVGKTTAGEWLNLRAIAALLVQQPGAIAAAEGRLWRLAIEIEDSGVADAKQRLANSRSALQDALNQPPSPAQQQQIDTLTRALQQAMQNYLAAMARQAARDGLAPPTDGHGQPVDPSQLQQMAQQLADAAKSGRMDDAQKRLAQLGAMLDRLRPSGQLAQNGAPSAKPNPALDRLRQDQAALQANTDQRLAGAGAKPDASAQRQSDVQSQTALRKRLGALALQLGDQTGQVPQGLARADGAMRDAQAALAAGDDRTARAAQQRALDGLASGEQQGQGGGAGGSQSAGKSGPRPGPGTDPLGRALTEGGDSLDPNDTALPTLGDAARSRALRDELRRRAADRTRPPAELQYLNRLLNY